MRRFAALGAVTAFAIYLHERSDDGAPARAPTIARSASVPASGELRPALADEAPTEEIAPVIADDVRRVGDSSQVLAALPEPDRTWVLERASTALAVGQISQELLAQHIDELASVRQFAVLEREATYTPPEDL